jgi:hypothetical protein
MRLHTVFSPGLSAAGMPGGDAIFSRIYMFFWNKKNEISDVHIFSIVLHFRFCIFCNFVHMEMKMFI